ncbi:hypothetical protein Leryth_014737 [Lithospermum erythrorhizon]|nr:hypothetical protein Leryth_014737 [Lithospermum erythrorhizon]
MAACRSLQHIFEKPLLENPTLFESLSTWSPIKSMKPIDNASFTELFGELHFKENDHGESNSTTLSPSPYPASPPSSVSSSSSTFSDSNNNHQLVGIERLFRDNDEGNKTPYSPTCYYPSRSSPKKPYRQRNSHSSMSSEGLSHYTESLGFESSDEVEEVGNDNISLDWRNRREEKQGANVVQEQSEYMYCDHKRSRANKASFPPPISCIGDDETFEDFEEDESGDDENFELKDIKEVDEDEEEEFHEEKVEDENKKLHIGREKYPISFSS